LILKLNEKGTFIDCKVVFYTLLKEIDD